MPGRRGRRAACSACTRRTGRSLWEPKKQPRACSGHSRTAPLLASQAPTSPNPLDALLHTQKFTKFLSELLHHYMVVRRRVRSASAAALTAEAEAAAGATGGSEVRASRPSRLLQDQTADI